MRKKEREKKKFNSDSCEILSEISESNSFLKTTRQYWSDVFSLWKWGWQIRGVAKKKNNTEGESVVAGGWIAFQPRIFNVRFAARHTTMGLRTRWEGGWWWWVAKGMKEKGGRRERRRKLGVLACARATFFFFFHFYMYSEYKDVGTWYETAKK